MNSIRIKITLIMILCTFFIIWLFLGYLFSVIGGLRQPYSDNTIGIAINFIIFSLSNPYGLVAGICAGLVMFLYINQAFIKAEKLKNDELGGNKK